MAAAFSGGDFETCSFYVKGGSFWTGFSRSQQLLNVNVSSRRPAGAAGPALRHTRAKSDCGRRNVKPDTSTKLCILVPSSEFSTPLRRLGSHASLSHGLPRCGIHRFALAAAKQRALYRCNP